MATIEAAIVARLAAVSAVTNLVGTRIYPNVLPQGTFTAGVTRPPAIRYQRISTPRLKALSGPVGRARPRIQIDCYATRHVDALALSEAVRGALDGFMGLVPLGEGSPQAGVQIDASSAEDEAGDYEDDVKVHRQRIDFVLSHQE